MMDRASSESNVYHCSNNSTGQFPKHRNSVPGNPNEVQVEYEMTLPLGAIRQPQGYRSVWDLHW